MPRYKQSEREGTRAETRRLLLEAATDEFARKGYEKANINDISKSAGFAKGTVYNYFPSKRDLMLALIDSIATMHLAFVSEQVFRVEEADRRLVNFFEAGFGFVESYFQQAQIMINNLYGADDEFKEVMFEAYRPMFNLVEHDVLLQGMSQKTFRTVEPRSTAGIIMNIYLATASQVDENGKPWLTAVQVSDFILHSLQHAADGTSPTMMPETFTGKEST